jgi:hypothetical protein
MEIRSVSAECRRGTARPTVIAREPVPLITAIEKFIAAQGACPQANLRDLAVLNLDLESGFQSTIRCNHIYFRKTNAPVDWIYSASSETAVYCILWRKLGWDPSLTWSRHRDTAEWIFDPGDGTDGAIIKLHID